MNIKIGTWNVRSHNGNEDNTIEETKLYDLDYLEITKIKKKDSAMTEMNDGYWLHWSGVNTNEWEAEGVGLIMKPERVNNLIEKRYINERMLIMETTLLRS